MGFTFVPRGVVSVCVVILFMGASRSFVDLDEAARPEIPPSQHGHKGTKSMSLAS